MSSPVQSSPRPVPPTSQLQPGKLTAGCLDDHAHYDEFFAYVSGAMRDQRSQSLGFAFGRRAVVRVTNELGQPIADARVTIRAEDALVVAAAAQAKPFAMPAAEWEITTDADGTVVFLSGLDAPAAAESEFVLTVAKADGGQPVSRRVSLNQTPWKVTLPAEKSELPQRLDLALIIDTTGSMRDELDYLKVEIEHIVSEVHERFPNVDQRFALILYRDEGDEYLMRSFDFTPDLSEFRRTLATQSAAGGGDEPEAMHLALEQATQLSWLGAGTARVAFLVADAPPHAQFAERTLAAAQKLRRAGVSVFPVAASGTTTEAELILRIVGFLTQGRYLFLTDHSGVGNPHAKPQAPRYLVEKLDQLMIRMIADKLSGHADLPRDIIAVEEAGRTADVGPANPQSRQPDRIVQPATVSTEAFSPSAAADSNTSWWGVLQILAIVVIAVLWRGVETFLEV